MGPSKKKFRKSLFTQLISLHTSFTTAYDEATLDQSRTKGGSGLPDKCSLPYPSDLSPLLLHTHCFGSRETLTPVPQRVPGRVSTLSHSNYCPLPYQFKGLCRCHPSSMMGTWASRFARRQDLGALPTPSPSPGHRKPCPCVDRVVPAVVPHLDGRRERKGGGLEDDEEGRLVWVVFGLRSLEHTP